MNIIVFGNDHTNTVGVIQSLGRCGYSVTGLLFGEKTGYVKSSRFTSNIISSSTPQDCVNKLLTNNYLAAGGGGKTPIVACSDIAALTLEANKEKLSSQFIFEYSKEFTLEYLCKKENQVSLAIESGFNVPKSWVREQLKDIPDDISYPCIIKPLISCEGAKSDIRVCNNIEDLQRNLNSLNVTKKVIYQQYIDRDFEISILGCGLSNGEVLIPAVENKLTLYPKYVGLECLASMQELTDESIITPIRNIIRKIGYVGLFSVEMMHSKDNGLFYFTEINLRNDGANAFVTKYGANLPLNHVEDLLGLPITKQEKKHPGYYIWDMHHLKSFLHRDISIFTWFSEIQKSKGFLMYDKCDKKPFFMQYIHMTRKLLRGKRAVFYK